MSSLLQPMFQKSLNSISMHMNALSIIPFFLFMFFLYKWYVTSSSRHKNLPPSPPKLPILGHLHKLGTHPHRSLQDLSKQFGELMLIHLGSRPTLVVSSARVAKEIMKTNDAIFSNRPKSNVSDKLLYNSREVAAAPYGEYWRQLKSIFVLQLLSNRRVRSFKNIREEETAVLVDQIKSSTSAVNLSEMLTCLTNDVICRVAFGRKYSHVQGGEIDFRDFLEDFNVLLGVFDVGDYIPWMGWINRFNGLYKRMDNNFKQFDMFIENILNEHSEKSSKSQEDFVDVLFRLQKENKLGYLLEKDSIKGLILDAFAAGTHTTATALEWTMSELLKNPKIMTKLQNEVRGVVKDKDNVTEEDIEQMKYLKVVIKESLRLHPPTPLLVPRESTHESKIDGYNIPAGTMVIINAYAVQNDSKTWEEPETFRPERFLDSTVDYKGQDFGLIPFGSGRRICPGIVFAAYNNELVLANLVLKFDWSLPNGAATETLDMSEGTGLTIRRRIPLLAVATSHATSTRVECEKVIS